MSQISLFINPQIRAYAQANGRVFSTEEIERITASVNSVTTSDDDGTVRFNLAGGAVQSLDAVIGAMSVGLGKDAPAAPKAGGSSTLPAGSNATERALALNAMTRDGTSAARAIEAQALVDAHGSPWDVRSINRTRQALVTNLDPALAARLRRQSGSR
ncbi:hypothetical protein [Methylobacterium sp. WL116]|uniref:hypothetical protein n=1 Tax=Methylobacterium sp. WL116 TaxID=2603889 RepID=UPI0011C7266B|nr:hypothetical protein [Methylobacterium sp. WL116]TXM91988.1 hypothetical protein FV223_13325 [Methylobacterium sp. WL116]